MAYNPQGGGYNNAGFGWEGTLNTLSGQNKYNIQTPDAQYDPTREEQDRQLALQQRGQQQQLAQAIQARALGQGGPSVAELQGQRGLAQAQQQAAQMAASGRGVDRAAAFRQAQNAQANMASEANSQAAMLRANEQIAAQQLGANVNQGIRGQDIQGREIGAQTGIAQLNATNQAQMEAEKLRAAQAEGNTEREQKAATAGLVALGGLLSDEHSKEKIRTLSAALDKARGRSQLPQEQTVYPSPEQSRRDLAPVTPKEFQYKPAFAQALGDQQGQRHVGVMAQDLERSPGYAGVVANTLVGKMLATPEQTAVNTAQLGGMDKRVKMLEEALAKAGPAAVKRVNEPVNRPKARGR